MRLRITLAALVAIGSAAMVTAAEDPRVTLGQPGMFVVTAIQDGLTEVTLGKLAQEKSTVPELKAFGARMIADHGKANADLAAIARRNEIKVPTELDPEHRSIVDKLAAAKGADFDLLYAQQMAQAHTRAVMLFTQASQDPNADLAAFATRTLPTLRAHKDMAEQLVRNRSPDAGAASQSR